MKNKLSDGRALQALKQDHLLNIYWTYFCT